MKLYISTLSLIILAVFYLPLVVWALVSIGRSQSLSRGKKALLIVLGIIVAYVIPLGDVTLNSIAMAKVCPQAGLHVYKTVKVEGYFDPSANRDVLIKHPYRFIETVRPGTKVIRFERQSVNDPIFRTELDQPTAQYEVVYDGWTENGQTGVKTLRHFVRNRTTGEVIAERLGFNPPPGWVDRYLVIRWFGGSLRGCHGAESALPIADKVLSPA